MPVVKPVLPDPGVPFQLVHHDDVASAIAAAVRGDGEPGVYNLAGAGTMTVGDLARALGWLSVRVPHIGVSAAAEAVGLLPLMPAQASWINALRVPVRDGHRPRPRGARLGAAARHARDARGHRPGGARARPAVEAAVPAGAKPPAPRDAGLPCCAGASRTSSSLLPAPASRPQLPRSPMRTQRWTLVVVCIATAMLMLDIAVVNTALSRIAEDLDTGLGGLQWVVDAYTLALASVVLTAGSLADRLGRRKLFTIGLSVFTLASVACAMAQDIVFLNSARAVQGIGAAIMFAVSLSLLANAYPNARDRAGALAAYGATIGASFALGPLVGGLLTSGLDWQWIFLINVPIGIASLYITRRYVEESRDPAAHGIDLPGQVTLSAGLFLLVLALLRGNEQGWTSTPIVLELAGAAVALIAFVLVERRVSQPMLPLHYFRDRSFTGAQIAAFAISASFFAVFLYTTIYMQQILGLWAIEAGLAYLPGTVIMLLVSAATASIGAKIPARTMIGGGLAMVAVGMGLFMLAEADSSWTIILPGLLVACIGTGFFNPALTNVALGSVPAEQSGVAAGVNDTYRQAGIAVGVAALGALIPSEHAFGGSDPAAYVSGFHDALLVGGILAAVGALAAWLLISKSYGAVAPAPVEEPEIAGARPVVTARPALDAA